MIVPKDGTMGKKDMHMGKKIRNFGLAKIQESKT